MRPAFQLHQLRRQMPNLPVPHQENIAEDGIKNAAITSGGPHGAFGDDHVWFFNRARDANRRASDERIVLDFPVEGIPSFDVKHPRYDPLNVVGQARQDVCVIGPVESVHAAAQREDARSACSWIF
jgi:hypothetical protein